MENQSAKSREGDVVDEVGSDRISQLPESVLLRILCFLSLKKAVQTCVLSKSWRHLGPTRPLIDLIGTCSDHVRGIDGVCDNCFEGNKEAFLSVLENTFQRYVDHNIFAQELDLEMLELDPKSNSVLENWIPIFINPDKHAVNTFRLSFPNGPHFNLPSVVLKAQSLCELHLIRCRLDEILSIDNFLLPNLQKLSLSKINISDEALEKIISGCPLVQRLLLYNCEGIETVNIGNKNPYLNYFEISSVYSDTTSIEIDVPTLQSIRIARCSNWYLNHNNYFPRVKSLFLSEVKLSADSFDNFSTNFPSLEELSLLHCRGFEEINLSSCSIKRLIIKSWRSTDKVSIDVPNILYFEFSSHSLPTTFSLTTTSGREWKSHLYLEACLSVFEDDFVSRLFKLCGMVKALSQSQISLTLSEALLFRMNQIQSDFKDPPLVLEHLGLNSRQRSLDSLTHYLNSLFRIFRPKYTYAVYLHRHNDDEVAKFLWKTLIHEREKAEYGWQQHLEEASIEASDKEGIVWHHVEWACLPRFLYNQKFRFRLKWRD